MQSKSEIARKSIQSEAFRKHFGDLLGNMSEADVAAAKADPNTAPLKFPNQVKVAMLDTLLKAVIDATVAINLELKNYEPAHRAALHIMIRTLDLPEAQRTEENLAIICREELETFYSKMADDCLKNAAPERSPTVQ